MNKFLFRFCFLVAGLFLSLLPAGGQTTATPTWVASGPTAATVLAMEHDPFTPGSFLAGTYFGGLYLTTDRGGHWAHVTTPFSGSTVFAIAYDPGRRGTVYAGTFDGGVYKTTDGGVTWTAINNGLLQSSVQSLTVVPASSVLLAVGGTQVFRSVDGGATWALADTGLSGIVARRVVADPLHAGRVWLGAVSGGVYRSDDSGQSWTKASTGMPDVTVAGLNFSFAGDLYAASPDSHLYLLPAGTASWQEITSNILGDSFFQTLPHPSSAGVLLAAGQNGTYLSANNGAVWWQVRSAPTGLLSSDDSGFAFFAADVHGLLSASTDMGQHWFPSQTGMQNVFVGGLATTLDGHVYAASDLGIFSSSTQAATWSLFSSYNQATFKIAPNPARETDLLAGTEKSGLWRSKDAGLTWATASGIVPDRVFAFAKQSGSSPALFAGTSAGLFVSHDNGATWAQGSGVAVPAVQSVDTDPVRPNVAYFGAISGGLYKTVDYGLDWGLSNDGLPPTDSVTQIKVSPQFADRVYAVTSGGQLYLTDNAGLRWTQGQPDTSLTVLGVAVNPTQPWVVYMATAGRGVYRSDSSAAAWMPVNTGLQSLYVFEVGLDPQVPTTVYAATNGGVYRSTDQGGHWTLSSTGLPSGTVSHVVVNPFNSSMLYASVDGTGLYRSVDGGASWTAMGSQVPQSAGYALAADPSSAGQLFAGTQQAGVYVSSDAGATWKQSNQGMSLFTRGIAFDRSNSNHVYTGAILGGGFFTSNDGGSTWGASGGLQNANILTVTSDPLNGSTVYVGTSEAVQKSTDGGVSFHAVGQMLDYIFSSAVDPADRRTIYVGGTGGAIFRSTDAGSTWTQVALNLPVMDVLAMGIDPVTGTIYAHPEKSGVYRSIDRGATWVPMDNTVLLQNQIVSFAFEPRLGVTYAATNGGGIFVNSRGSTGWSASSAGLTSNVATSISVDPFQQAHVYAAMPSAGVAQSTDGGAHWALTWGVLPIGVSLVQSDPLHQDVVWAGGTAGLYRSADDGRTWVQAGGVVQNKPVLALLFDQFVPGVMYAALSTNELARSTDEGASWKLAAFPKSSAAINQLQQGTATNQIFAATLGSGLVRGDGLSTWAGVVTPPAISPFVLAIAVDPVTAGTVYAGTSAGVIKSTDGGLDWTAMSNGLTSMGVLALAIDPVAPQTVYAAGAGGVYVSDNGGASWKAISDGLFHPNITAVTVDRVNHKIVYAGTEGGGVFKYVRH